MLGQLRLVLLAPELEVRQYLGAQLLDVLLHRVAQALDDVVLALGQFPSNKGVLHAVIALVFIRLEQRLQLITQTVRQVLVFAARLLQEFRPGGIGQVFEQMGTEQREALGLFQGANVVFRLAPDRNLADGLFQSVHVLADLAAFLQLAVLDQFEQQVVEGRYAKHPVLGDVEAVVLDLFLEIGQLFLFMLQAQHVPLVDDPEGPLQHPLALTVHFRQQLDLLAFQQVEHLHGDDEGLGVVFHVGLGHLAVARVDHAQAGQIHQHHVFRDIDVGQVNFGLVHEQHVFVVFRHVAGKVRQGDFLHRAG